MNVSEIIIKAVPIAMMLLGVVVVIGVIGRIVRAHFKLNNDTLFWLSDDPEYAFYWQVYVLFLGFGVSFFIVLREQAFYVLLLLGIATNIFITVSWSVSFIKSLKEDSNEE